MSEPQGTLVSHTITEGVAEVVLDRPPLNVLNMEMMKKIVALLDELGKETTLRALLFRSRGKAFSAGVEVSEHLGKQTAPMIDLFHELMQKVEAFPVPTIAVVSGAALGGGMELALACDMRVVAEEAKLGVPEINLGVYPPYALVRLPQLVGYGRAARLIFTGEVVKGKTAHELGLTEVLAPRAELEEALKPIVQGFRMKSAAALRLTKEALRCDHRERDAMLATVEETYLGPLMSTHDATEGLTAFLEKREPKWLHR